MRGMRPGFVPFNARCIAARLVREEQTTVQVAMRELQRFAQQCGGELVEGEVLWLPERDFEELWSAG